jgi:hypothetical protein
MEYRPGWLYTGNHTVELTSVRVIVLVTEQGWIEKQRSREFDEAPLLLDFAVTQGLPPHRTAKAGIIYCSQDVHRMVCKSEHSGCHAPFPGYACSCDFGYYGNPYHCILLVAPLLLPNKVWFNWKYKNIMPPL